MDYDDRGDADADGDTDGDDFLIWQAQFGSGGGSAARAADNVAETTLKDLDGVSMSLVSPLSQTAQRIAIGLAVTLDKLFGDEDDRLFSPRRSESDSPANRPRRL